MGFPPRPHFGKFYLDEQKIQWISAGQESPILFRNGKISKLKGESSGLLGLDIDTFQVNTALMQSKDIIILFSDGAINAAPEGGDPFGDKRFDELVLQNYQQL